MSSADAQGKEGSDDQGGLYTLKGKEKAEKAVALTAEAATTKETAQTAAPKGAGERERTEKEAKVNGARGEKGKAQSMGKERERAKEKDRASSADGRTCSENVRQIQKPGGVVQGTKYDH